MYKLLKKIKDFFLYYFYYKPTIKKILGKRPSKRSGNNILYRPPGFDEKTWIKIIYRALLLNKRMMKNEEKINKSSNMGRIYNDNSFAFGLDEYLNEDREPNNENEDTEPNNENEDTEPNNQKE